MAWYRGSWDVKQLSNEEVRAVEETGKQHFDERQRRIQDAIQLKVPDRVPVWLQDAGYFPAKYVGITCEEALFESHKLYAAYKKTLIDFDLDMYFGPGQSIRTPGGALETVDCKLLKLPGRGISPLHSHQFVEGEYMKAEEYDELIDDPVDFAIRKYLARVYGVLKPLENLPPLHLLLAGYASMAITPVFALPEISAAFESVRKAGIMVEKHRDASIAFNQEMADLGFPLAFNSGAQVPFDLISDFLRGMRGTATDMYRRPEKLVAAMEKLTPRMISSAITVARASGNPGVFIALHRGADGFMSLKQFESFYWPWLKKIIVALVEADLTPCVFFEGDYTSRLQYLTELPKAKVLGMFDNTDPLRAKEIIGKTMCISGMMPLSLLQFGTPEEVRVYAKKLIDVVGRDGGFIMGPKSIMDEANPALVKVWIDFTKEYGVYG
jgi:hypothetical protein